MPPPVDGIEVPQWKCQQPLERKERPPHCIQTRPWRDVAAEKLYGKDSIDAGAPVSVTIKGIPAKTVQMTQYRIDQEHSYTTCKQMGSPANPAAAQIAALEKSGQLATQGAPTTLQVRDRQVVVDMQLPRQAVSFIKLSY